MEELTLHRSLQHFAVVLAAGLLVACGSGPRAEPEPTATQERPQVAAAPTSTPVPAPTPPSKPTPSPRAPTPTAAPLLAPLTRLIILPYEQTKVEMVAVAGGNFTMGASPEERGEFLRFGFSRVWTDHLLPLVESSGPRHEVYLDGYYIDKHEVTNSQYSAFTTKTGHAEPGNRQYVNHNRPDQPVVGVPWHDAKAFCEWAGKRLPTEAEWEKAARGPDGLQYPWGDHWDASRLWSIDGILERSLDTFEVWSRAQQELVLMETVARPAQVGSYPDGASPYGAMDMAGNVWEWVGDWYGARYYSESPQRNPKGPESGEFRVLRGGAWDVPRMVIHTWFRENVFPPDHAGSLVTGFRCAMDES